MGSNDKAIESYKTTLTMAASVAASVMLVRGVINEFVPPEVWNFLFSGLNQLRSRVSPQHTIVIEENEGFCTNQVFGAVRTYLASRINTDMQRLRVSRVDESKNIMVSMEAGEEMIDKFDGTDFKWQLVCRENTASSSMNNNNFRQLEMRSYELHFHKDYKDKALNTYLPFILQMAKEINEQERTLKIYMNEVDTWCPVDLHHPSTFDTLAMDSELKQSLMDDLARFVKRRDYYKRIGKAWKRGYLLYGPPGTGKSSLVAAIANYLKFDVYDLELTEVRWNSTLRRLLIGMSNRSILVIEDIDCTIELQQRDDNNYAGGDDEKITLSGLLNFVDGLWSTSGEERIIIFTTNYKERLDPALTRPGRMDMHIHMGYCSLCGFRVLVKNYHSIDDHSMFPEIDGLLKEVEVTPAEVAEVLMKSDIADVALEGLVEFLKGKKERATEGEKEGENSGEEKDLLELEAGESRIMTPTTTSKTED
ncbi:P-loop containing nucleoside triphosphate hydrolases superfamily protein [Rhynchospora pubera]|uniref:P-loop containing nucleoside triphosphate hydrolases superfamily protein n=1 Tax=Rhynchospora pubera TaxID=906938 RepID=A0AAV8DQB4_9POAL|nr:P-loop containing nucleoside triphosphate hydrolases superfamily protein [Rhynchospora pubera]